MLSLVGKSDLSKHCRVCLNQPDEDDLLDLNLIYDEEEQINYYECFTTCTHLSLDDENGFPRNLCKSCGIELQMAYDFHKRVQESQRTLRQWKEENRIIIKRETTINDDEEVNIVNVEEVPLYQIEKLEEDNVAEESPPDTDLELGFSLNSGFEILQEDLPIEEENVVNDFERDCKFEAGDTSIVVFEPLNNIAEGDAETLQNTNPDSDTRPINSPFLVTLCESDLNPNIDIGVNIDFSALDELESESLLTKDEFCDLTDEADQLETISVHSNDNDESYAENVNDIDEDDNTDDDEQEFISNDFEIVEEETSEIVESESSSPQTVKAVRRRHVGKSVCEYCNKEFQNRSRMILHRRCHEPHRLKYSCDECGRVYMTKQAMQAHIRVVHTKKGFNCPVCNKIYPIRKCLEIHMRFHTGEFPYSCDLCDKKFAQLCHLKTHKNVKHNNVRYSCQFPDCGKYFTSSASLRNHEFSHSIMPFECSFCQRGYPAKAKLKAHIKRKHDQDMTLEELEPMRKFQVLRSKLNMVQLVDAED